MAKHISWQRSSAILALSLPLFLQLRRTLGLLEQLLHLPLMLVLQQHAPHAEQELLAS